VNAAALSYISALRADPHPSPDYQVCHTADSLDDYFNYGLYGADYLALDTESLPDGTPYCATISWFPGTGRLIYAHDAVTLRRLAQYLPTFEFLLFHNYLHDVHPFAYLGLPIHDFRDTMVLAYLACLGGGASDDDSGLAGRGSLSLKSLAYRHCNMAMTSFRDTVYPHSVPKLVEYLKGVSAALDMGPDLPTCECRHLREDHLDRGKTGKLKGKCSKCGCDHYKLHTVKKDQDDKLLGLLGRKTNNLLASIAEVRAWNFDDEDEDEEPDVADYTYTDLDPYRRIKKWHLHDHEYLPNLAGLVPKASIADVPEKDLVTYAVKDADATLRLHLFLKSYYPWLFY
jgi:hypothetical protein